MKGRKYQRTSIVARKMGANIIAPLEYAGTMHGDFFEAWFEKHLLPELPEDVTIILDNASFHREKRLYEIAQRCKRKIIFLPPYSPELNLIEHFWHWLKETTADCLKFCSKLKYCHFGSASKVDNKIYAFSSALTINVRLFTLRTNY